MASNYTTNYELPLWEQQDSFLRTEFNEAHQKIDAALAGKASATAAAEAKALAEGRARLAVGSYTGNGSTTMSLTLPFKPEFVLIRRFSTWDEGAYIFEDNVAFQERETAGRAEITGDYYKVVRRDDGLSLICSYVWEGDEKQAMVCNRDGQTYCYVALG